jgi:CO dehydrogenase/acetyl-CoA synthase epsilon subunit
VNTVTTTTASSSGQFDCFLLVRRTYERSRNNVNMASALKNFMSVKKMAMIQKNSNNHDTSFYEVFCSSLLTFPL